jgi:putative zinc finger/helix-turn-helix YgiT family protein
MKRCAECGGLALSPAEVTEERTVAGRTFTATMPATRCGTCEATYVSGPVLERFELLIARELAAVGERSGEGLRWMRKALGFKANELAALLGVTGESVSRWETGKHPAPPDVIATLAAMADDRLEGRSTTLERLRALQAPRPTGERRDLGHVLAPAA